MSYAPVASKSRLLGVLSVALVVSPGMAHAQDAGQQAPARLQGVVVMEATFEPIAGAVITLVGTDIEARTGSMGDFAIQDPPAGWSWVRVAAPGLPAVREQVQISETGVIFLQFRMPEDVTALLDEVLVDVAARATDATDVETALDMVAAKEPSITMRMSGDVGNNNGAVRLRGFTSLTQDGNPIVVIDDVVARGAPPLQILSEIPASDVDSIQILKGPAAAFRYPWAANGVIRVTTRKN